MFKTILAPGLNSGCNPQALELGLRVARLFGGHLEFLHVHPDAQELARASASLDIEAALMSSQLWDAFVEGDKKSAARSRKVFDAFCTREQLTCCDDSGHSDVTASWREVDGNSRSATIARACYNDLVVLARPLPPEDLSSAGASDILVGCGRPLLLAPSSPCSNPLSKIVIGWKATAASARAVAAAMPLLAKAEKIDILGIAEGDEDEGPVLSSVERLAEHLRWHGLKPQAGHIRADDRNACDVLLEAAADKLHAGLLVMGGYGHSRAREFIFGGFTRRVLHSAPLPVLLSH